jgi:putative FmdB family regulatory protein
MPLYEYQCESCAERFERIQKYSDPPIATCPSCNGPVRKLPSSPAIQFKGTGWYITDYAKKSSGESKSGEGSKDSSSSSSSSSSTDGSGSTATPKKESAESKPASKDSGDSSAGTKSGGSKAGSKND